MSIASEITDLNTNLQAAKSAVTTKGGTVGDTGLAGLASEILTIPNGGGQAEPSNGGHITGYNTTTGVIDGDGFGTTAGTVYLLDRATNTYVAQPTSSWSATSITLTTPIDVSTIEGHTSLAVVDSNGKWTSKWLITGGIALASGVVKIYVQNPDTRAVRTITTTTSSAVSALTTSSSNYYSIQKTIEGETVYTDEIVGFQMDLNSTMSISSSFLRAFINLNQPVVVSITSSSFGIPDYFLSLCTSFNQPVEIRVTEVLFIGSSFMANDYSFNQPISLPDSISSSVGNYFMSNCYSFNQPLVLPKNSTGIGNYFLFGAISFNEDITFPTSLRTIGDYFLTANLANSNGMLSMAFNKPLNLPSTLTSIGSRFLNQCANYDQPITLPEGITTIGAYFLSGTEPNISNHYVSMRFNSKITLPSTLTSIGIDFLRYCVCFNQPISIPNNVTTIGDNFMAGCYSFNSPISLSTSLASVGTNFCSGWSCFNQDFTFPASLNTLGSGFGGSWACFNRQLTVPATITTISGTFMYSCYSITNLVVETTATPTTTNNSLAVSSSNSNSKSYVKGITVTGAGTSAWLSALPNSGSTYRRKLIDGTA